MNMFLRNAKRLWDAVITNALFLALALISLGLLAIIVGYVTQIQIIDRIGTAVFSAGVFSAFFKAMQATGIFSEELAKIIYFDPESNYLKRRNDLKDIWYHVTRALHGNAFPSLENKIWTAIRETYLPTNLQYYFQGLTVYHRIEWFDEPRRLIKAITLLEGAFIPNGELRDVAYTCRYFTKTVHGVQTQHKFTKLVIGSMDGVASNKLREEQSSDGAGYKYQCSLKIPNEGQCKFEAEYFVIQCLDDDNIIGFVASSYVDELSVDVESLIGSIRLVFHPFGTHKEYRDVGFEGSLGIKKKYDDGILFARQGCMVEMMSLQ